MMTNSASGMYTVTVARRRESHDKRSGTSISRGAAASSSAATSEISSSARAKASVIGFAVLPFAPPYAEEAQQRCGDQERDHRHRDRGAFAQLRSRDRALKGKCGHQVRRVE